MDAKACKKIGGQWDSKKKVCRFVAKRTMSNKGWVLQKRGSDILILDRETYDPDNPLRSYVGALLETEEDWQPKSIQINQDTLARMVESNTAIFFPRRMLRAKKWKNIDVRRAR